MKKLVAIFLVLAAMMGAVALAEGVQMISAPNTQAAEEVFMDDIKLGKEIEVEGYGVITPISCDVYDSISFYNRVDSGNEAQLYVLVIEILNKQYVPASYVESVAVEAEFGEGYKFGGWWRQYQGSESNDFKEKGASYEVNPLYVGKYAFGVTVPNFVAESTEPLSITVSLSDDIVLTYHVRK